MFEDINMLLQTDLQERHENDIQTKPVDIICPICDCQYVNEKQFYDHLNVHTGDTQLKYTEWPEGCIETDVQSKQDVSESLQENVARPFKCKQCDLTFDRASQFDYHHRSIHLGEKSQLCEICGKGFFRKTDLRTHLNIHLGTNLCICEICGRRFNHISNLIRHCRMHAGVKPYPCSICGKRFTQISSLARHKRIHERSKESVKQQLQNNGDNNKSQATGSSLNKDKISECNTPNHRKVVKRQHYCRVCGESFGLIYLLKQHEKSHSENTSIVECKNCKMRVTELKGHKCQLDVQNSLGKAECSNKQLEESILKICTETDKSKELCQLETDGIKESLPLDTIIYITSEQFKKIHLDHIEENKNVSDMSSKNAELTKKATELNISDITLSNNCEQIQFTNNNPDCLYKSNDFRKTESSICICQLDKNGISTCEKYKSEKIESLKKVLDPFNLNEAEQIINTDMHSYQLNEIHVYEHSLCIENSQQELQKLDAAQNNNITTNISVNINDHIKPDLISQKTDFINFAQSDNVSEDLHSENSITNHEEPMLRLVQTETGEQFYEFIISNLDEKLSNIQSLKTSEEKLDEAIICENIRNATENTKDVTEQIEGQQNLRDITDIHADLNYSQYGLHEEKNFVGNQVLLGNDPQTDFDRYVETNFEVFDRLNYETSSERFLEFVENVEGPSEPMVQNEGEEIFELLQGSETTEKDQDENFDQVGRVEPNESICENNGSDQLPLTCCEDNTSEVDTNSTLNIKENIKQARSKEDSNKNEKEEDVSQETKKSKVFLIKFQCTVCEKSFSTGYNYKQHIGTHFADQQKFHCKECKMSFAWKSTLNKHIASNHRPEGPQKFVCELCPKVYNTSSQVNEHVKRDHLKQRNHVCSHCGKSFFKKYDLKIHNRIHTDERPYVCRACGKRFHHRSHIIRHERIHF